MPTETLIFLLLSFTAGAAFAWLLARSRTAVQLSDLKAQAQLAQEKTRQDAAELNRLQQLLQALNTQHAESEKQVVRLAAELKALGQNLSMNQEELRQSTIRGERLQSELQQALRRQASVEAELGHAQNRNADLAESEAVLKGEGLQLTQQVSLLKEELSRLNAQHEEKTVRLQEQQQFIDTANTRLKESFAALSAEALNSNNSSFVTLARQTLETQLKEAEGQLQKKEEAIQGIIHPLSESLKTMDTKINELERTRMGAYRDIWNHLERVQGTAEGLRKETTSLVSALKTSHTRGRYGEIGLRRLVEYAGMVDHCHFQEQVSVEGEGGRLRPDMIIKLPESKKLVVDSKAPLAAYLRIFETDDPEQQRVFLNQHTAAVRDHLNKLSAKSYWQQFDEAPDFVIMYIHIESSFGAALQACPELIEEAFRSRVIIATPTILVSILMSVGYSWNQIKTMENIEEIRSAAVELFERSTVFISHVAALGSSLDSSIKHYNSAVGSLEHNFLPQARRIQSMSQAYTKKLLKDLETIELTTRSVSPRMLEGSGESE